MIKTGGVDGRCEGNCIVMFPHNNNDLKKIIQMPILIQRVENLIIYDEPNADFEVLWTLEEVC